MVDEIIINIIIIAGGKGTRSLNPTVPKSLQEVSGKKLIQVQLDEISKQTAANIFVVGGYGGYELDSFLLKVKNDYKNLRIRYLHDDIQSGTFQALKIGIDCIKGDFSVVILGDIAFTCDLLKFYQHSLNFKSFLSIIAHPNSHPNDSDLLKIDLDLKINKLLLKNRTKNLTDGNLAAAGVFFVNNQWVTKITKSSGDMTEILIENVLKQREPSFAWVTCDLVMDLGTSKRIKNYENYLISGHLKKRSGIDKEAIFLDLDDTLFQNIEIKNLSNLPKVSQELIETFRKLNILGIPIVVCTNQPGIAKGLFTENDFLDFKRGIEFQLADGSAFIDAWYICPHHPEKGWPGEVVSLKIDCECRKPKIGMFEKARDDLGINLSKSIFFGNSESDSKAAMTAGLNFVKVYNKKFDFESNELNLEIKKVYFDHN